MRGEILLVQSCSVTSDEGDQVHPGKSTQLGVGAVEAQREGEGLIEPSQAQPERSWFGLFPK